MLYGEGGAFQPFKRDFSPAFHGVARRYQFIYYKMIQNGRGSSDGLSPFIGVL
jgi:hypothetical protein